MEAFSRIAGERLGAAVPSPGVAGPVALGTGAALLGTLAALALRLVPGEGEAFRLFLLLLAGFAGGWLAAHRAIGRYHRRTEEARSPAGMARAPWHYRLDAEGLLMEGPHGLFRWNWKAITGLSETRGLILVWTGPADGFAIPARAFPSSEEARAALAFARDRLAAARA